MHPAPISHGELLHVPDRIVVAPRTGVFIPLERCRALEAGSTVRSGQVIGHVRCGHEMLQVTSPFDGVARDVLAWPNERVRRYQPLLWLRARAN
jgi:biotin carboxyl carrier protein